MISVIIPVGVRDWGSKLLITDSLAIAKKNCLEPVEIIIVVNPLCVGRVKAKNAAVENAVGDKLVFVDCDIKVSSNFLSEVSKKGKNNFFVGGGVKFVKLSRYSTGILCWIVLLFLLMLIRRVTIGAFWVRREAFLAIGGFKEKKFDDIDFAIRLKNYAKQSKKKFESLKESSIIWSTRKFDTYGDWHWINGYKID